MVREDFHLWHSGCCGKIATLATCGYPVPQLKKMWGNVFLGELSVWTLSACKWRAAGCRAPRGVGWNLAGFFTAGIETRWQQFVQFLHDV